MKVRRLIPGVLLALGVAGCTLDGGRRPAVDPSSATAVDAGRVRAAWRLVDARPQRGPAVVTATTAQQMTERLRSRIPLPRGGTFAGVRWKAVGAAAIPLPHVSSVLYMNAACQWTRALREGREPGTAEQVLLAARRWPALAGAPVDGPDFVLSCYAAHAREVRWAQRLDRRPST